VLEKVSQASLPGLFKSGPDFVKQIENGDFAAVVLMDNHLKAVVQEKPMVWKHFFELA
jgi:hypothetical protein